MKPVGSKPTVTVIIPCYNQAHFLPASVQSVLDQTFPDWETIIVNDGSTDDTADTACQFNDIRIRYIYQENRGLAGARNTGIRAARAEIIALLDADDLWEPEFLEEMLGCLNHNPHAAAVYCGHRFIDADGRPVGKPSLRVVPPDRFYQELTGEGNWLIPGAVVFRKKAAEEFNLFDETMRAVEDTDLWIRMAEKYPFVGVPRVLVKYRRHGNNMTGNPQHMITALYQLTEKQHGPLEGDISTWPPKRRLGYAHLYESAAVLHLAAGNFCESADYLEKLIEIHPEYACEMGVWRGLARSHLPLEFRGDSEHFDWPRASRDVIVLLDQLSDRRSSSAGVRRHFRKVKANAYVSLAREAVETGRYIHSAGWLARSAAVYPAILFYRRYWGTALRGIMGAGGVFRRKP